MYLLVALFFLMISTDVAVRWTFLSDLTPSQVAVYVGSIALELLVLIVLIASITREKYLVRKTGLKAWLLALGLVYSFGLFSSWSFFTYFKTLPGVFAFSYLFSEPEDFLSIMGSGVQWYKVAAILGAGFLWAGLAYFVVKMRVNAKAGRKLSSWAKPRKYAAGLLLASLVLILQNNTRISPGVATPLTDGIFAFKTAVVRQIQGQQGWVRLQRRLVGDLPEQLQRDAPFNVLVIVNESLRRRNLGFYGYAASEKSTTPRLGTVLTDSRYKAVFFERAVSNATMTSVSIPSVLTGISPAQGFDALHRSYLIFEQAKRLGKLRTALISSHSYATGNFRAFLASEAIDFLWCRETDNLPAYNNVGADDRHVPDQFEKFMRTVDENEKFFAVLHTNGTHYPYTVPIEYRSGAPEHSIGAYDDAIRYLDANLGRVFDELTRRDLLESTLIVFTSDHGESFGEDGTTGHFGAFSMFNANIPLVIAVPTLVEKNIGPQKLSTLMQNSQALVSNADLFPTVLDLYAIPYKTEAYPGMSLLAEVPEDRPVILYNLVDTGVKKSYLGVFRRNLGLVVTKDETTSTMSALLHDFDSDPGASKNLWSNENESNRQSWREIVRRYPLIASYAEALTPPQ